MKQHTTFFSSPMLKALELNGFKSFADSTRFDFPDGITVVVGPNGSGKSNIVDAIKWVLGSQSAKGLRGGDMSDVIFKGSASSGRKPSNSAEATLVLDNASKALNLEAEEVTVTRRVYRSGESEYLINRQPCRLKDIRDLFRGTGVGVDAYSLIEQGKVDRMLQASPKDRRAIFEEAAGISRFKAKKVEAERRLQRVNQNLLRLSDIVEEVHGRLNVIKSQASKAQRYREMVARLNQLRTRVGYAEFAELDAIEVELEARAESLAQAIQNKTVELEHLKNAHIKSSSLVAQMQQALSELQSDIRRLETTEISLQSQQLSLCERAVEMQAERDSIEQQIDQLHRKRDISAQQVTQRQSTLESMQSQCSQLDFAVSAARELSHSVDLKCESLSDELDADRSRLEQLRSGNSNRSYEIHSIKLQIADQDRRLLVKQSDLVVANDHLAAQKASLELASQETEVREQELQTAEVAQVAMKGQVAQEREALREATEEGIVLQGKYESMQDRHDLLEQLDKEHNGLGDGAKQLIELSKAKPYSPYNTITGLVADLISVEVHLAPLIDVALSHLSEAVVLSDGQIVDLLQQRRLKLNGKATLFRLDRLPSRRNGDRIQLDGLRGVIGRADRLIQIDERFQPLAQFLLGTTWLVDSLQTALDLSHYRGSGLRFVTAECERIDTDGTIQIGYLQTLSGIVTRRSEMQSIRAEADKLKQTIEVRARQVAALRSSLEEAIQFESSADKIVKSANIELERSKLNLFKQSQEHSAALATLQAITDEIERLNDLRSSDVLQLQELHRQSEADGELMLSLESKLNDKQNQLKMLQSDKHAALEAVTGHLLEKAKFDHRMSSEEEMLRAMVLDFEERQTQAEQAQQRHQGILEKLELNRQTTAQNLTAIEATKSELTKVRAQLEQRSAAFEVASQELALSQKSTQVCGEENSRLTKELEETRQATRQTNEKRVSLIQHYLSEYEIDLTRDKADEQTADAFDKGAATREINELRPEIASVGSVNLEALAELDDLQTRYDRLHAHYVDLESARDSLLKIIERIDAKSREMFVTTLESIRNNFQTLYRRSFGGGSADIVLEDPNDVLNCGVDVIATPPGKIALSNSLLSGGEKALTAVALIMAIFQFRPSPFCILDEVDAPFDEANIGRFVNVLKDFLHMTKFIVVSHSKKTMTVANTIYGVTMQESGISRQVAVRFEEVGPDGEILTQPSTATRAA